MQMQFSGRTSAFQADRVGSIPIICSTCANSSAGQSNCLLSSRSGVRVPFGAPNLQTLQSSRCSVCKFIYRRKIYVPVPVTLLRSIRHVFPVAEGIDQLRLDRLALCNKVLAKLLSVLCIYSLTIVFSFSYKKSNPYRSLVKKLGTGLTSVF